MPVALCCLLSRWQEQQEQYEYEDMLEDGGAGSCNLRCPQCFDSWQVERRRAELEHARRQQVEARLPEAMRGSVTRGDCHAGETCHGRGAERRGGRSWSQGVVTGRLRQQRRSRP